MKRQNKIENVLPVIRQCIDEGKYLDTRHASERGHERGITRPEIVYVLKNGRHEKSKDKFEERLMPGIMLSEARQSIKETYA